MPPTSQGPSRGLVLVFALACGLAVANLYYAQPLLHLLAAGLHSDDATAALVVTMTQIGYAVGLVLVVPLGDLLENRRLVCAVLVATAAALAGGAAAPTMGAFLAASLAVGTTSVVAQVLVPFAAALAPDAVRGRVVGQVMSGLLVGILLARALSSIVAAELGWRSIYVISAGLMLVLAVLLRLRLPQRRPEHRTGYGRLLASLVTLTREEPVLRRRAGYQAAMFGAFSAFWTSITYELVHAHHLGQRGIALFSLVGAAGAVAAPVAGRLADSGHGRLATGGGLALGALSAVLAGLGASSVALLALAAVLLDLAAQTTLVVGQRDIYSRRPQARARMNTVYIAVFFAGGAAASAASGYLYHLGGWPYAAALVGALPAVAFLGWLPERARAERARVERADAR